jgi:hypothetical protein
MCSVKSVCSFFRASYRDSLHVVRIPGDGVLVLATVILGFAGCVLSCV